MSAKKGYSAKNEVVCLKSKVDGPTYKIANGTVNKQIPSKCISEEEQTFNEIQIIFYSMVGGKFLFQVKAEWGISIFFLILFLKPSLTSHLEF